ncbi:MAG TPA: hypothetical protein VIM44_04655 [Rariglobus sp.]
MDWILDHLQLVIAIAGAIAYWLNARKKEKAGEPADYDGDGKPDVLPQDGRALREQTDPVHHDDNTRRVQEEIRRLIAERNRTESRPVAPPLPPAPAITPRRREPEPASAAMEVRREETERETADVLERQRGLADQFAALQARRAEATREAKAVWTVQPVPVPATVGGDIGLLRELRNARSLRKAIVLREVLGTPAGLR